MIRTPHLKSYWLSQNPTFGRIASCLSVLLATIAQLTILQAAFAGTVTYPYSVEYSNGTPPAGAAPWLTAVFDDENTPGTVKLKMTASNLTGSEFVSNWLFNLNPAISPSDISFSAPTKTGGNGFADPSIGLGANAFNAGPDMKYDIEFSFATSNAGGGSQRFGVGEMAEYLITGSGSAAGLVALDFYQFSQPGNAGVGGPYRTAAHVQGIGASGDDSGWITVNPLIRPDGMIPEPATWMLMALALGTLSIRRS